MKRAIAFLLSAALLLSPALGAGSPAFSDVPSEAWFAPYVEVCTQRGLLQGTGAETFSPQGTVSMGETVVMAARTLWQVKGGSGPIPRGGTVEELAQVFYAAGIQMHGQEALEAVLGNFSSAVEPFAQSYAWDGLYYLYTQATDQERLLLPDFHLCDPNLRMATRQEFFSSMAFAARGLEMAFLNDIQTLPDTENKAILALYRAGILSGVDEYGTFSATQFLTRAEAAAALARILDPELRLGFTLEAPPLPEILAALPGTVRVAAPSRSLISAVYADPPLLYPEEGSGGPLTDWAGNVLMDNFHTRDNTLAAHFLPDGVALAERNGRYGFVNLKGEEVVPCQYEKATTYHDGVLLAGDEKNGFTAFDATGQVLGHLDGSVNYNNTTGGLIQYREGERYGYLHPDGTVAVEAAYRSVYPVSEGMAPVRDSSGLVGFVDVSTGALAIPCRFDVVSAGFSQGLTVVGSAEDYASPLHYNGKLGMVDRDGAIAIPMKYNALEPFHDGLAVFARWGEGGEDFVTGYLTPDGTEHPVDWDVETMGYATPAPFSFGLAPFRENGKYGLMDTGFRRVAQPQFDQCTPGPDGQVLLLLDGVYYLWERE